MVAAAWSLLPMHQGGTAGGGAVDYVSADSYAL